MSSLEVREFPALRLASMRYTGTFFGPGIAMTWARFGSWAGARGLMLPEVRMLGISLDNPQLTPAALCRYDCAIVVDESFQPDAEVEIQTFPGGRYACVPFKGTAMEMGAAWMKLFSQDLPQAGLSAVAALPFELYTGLHTVDPATGRITCLLCAGVAPK
ncbi:AraC family transcriptional regulator [Variovorax sp. HJSM1_2]|uniref:AraC family transcriptional regulator n=1 Tax=Variovorax sp. HJSM1_2 TaxID=3366263 RepID=UPI003BBB6E69